MKDLDIIDQKILQDKNTIVGVNFVIDKTDYGKVMKVVSELGSIIDETGILPYFESVEDDGVVVGQTVKVTYEAKRLEEMWIDADIFRCCWQSNGNRGG